jgi:hypothetical protein
MHVPQLAFTQRDRKPARFFLPLAEPHHLLRRSTRNNLLSIEFLDFHNFGAADQLIYHFYPVSRPIPVFRQIWPPS